MLFFYLSFVCILRELHSVLQLQAATFPGPPPLAPCAKTGPWRGADQSIVRSLTGHYCITRGCPGNLPCPVSRCPRGHGPLFSGGVGAFSVRREEQGRSWAWSPGGPGGILVEQGNGSSFGEESPHVTMCPIQQILHTLNVFFNLYLQTICSIAPYETCPTCSVLKFFLAFPHHWISWKSIEDTQHTSLLPIVRVRKHILIR